MTHRDLPWYRDTVIEYRDALFPEGVLVSSREAAKIIGTGKTTAAEFLYWVREVWMEENLIAISSLSKASPVGEARRGRIVVLSDIHIPYEDTALVQKIIRWLASVYLDTVILNGDILDCAKISKYLGHDELSLAEELERGNVFLDQICEAARLQNKAAKIYWVDGNHEDRLNKYLMANAADLIDLQVDGEPIVSLQHLLKLRARRIHYKSYSQCVELPGKLFVEHGHRVSKNAAYSVSNAMRDLGGSLIMGHVHRIGSAFKTDRNGVHRGYEQGCLCLPPSYMPEQSANWQRGFGVVTYTDATTWWYQQVVAQDGNFMVDGELY
jgi:predicted phosphodiesterase